MIRSIKSIFLDKSLKIIPQRVNLGFLSKNHPKELVFIEESFDGTYTLSEKIYCICFDLEKRPKCSVCGNELIFRNGYNKFCSRKCSNSDDFVKNKIKQSVSISLKKVYKDNGFLIKEKRSKSLLKKYGELVKSPFGLSEVKDKIKKTNLKKYGVENVFCLQHIKEKIEKYNTKKSVKFNKSFGYDIDYTNDSELLVKNLCKIHGDVNIDTTTFYNRVHKNRRGVVCPICNPIKSFNSLEIEFDSLLKELNITNYIKKDRCVIKPLELDFYFPDYNIAIELNGLYWHSEIYKDKYYHVNKTNLCESKNIQLIHIWEDDFYHKRDLIKSIISNKFKQTKEKIYARNCDVKEISSYEYRSFLINNHIQGSVNSSIKLGLFYNNELVSVLGVGLLRSSLGNKEITDKNYEIHRFCTKLNTNVIGGASKLFKYFESSFDYESIISYAKRDYSIGGLYKQLGFVLEKTCDPGYFWVVNGVREHRYKYRKNVIKTTETEDLTEVEIMHNKGFFRCYDSGNLKFIKKIN